jgi:hypothetical protein
MNLSTVKLPKGSAVWLLTPSGEPLYSIYTDNDIEFLPYELYDSCDDRWKYTYRFKTPKSFAGIDIGGYYWYI